MNQTLDEIIDEMHRDRIYFESETIFKMSTGEMGTVIRCYLEFEGKNIAECRLYTPTIELYESGLDIFFDEIEDVAFKHYRNLEKNDPLMIEILEEERFVYLTGMKVNSTHRNKGVGSIFLEKICEYLELSNIENLLLTSGLYEDNKDQDKIDRFYLKNDFDMIADLGEDGKLMYHVVGKNIYK